MRSGGHVAGRLAVVAILAGAAGCATVSRAPGDGATRAPSPPTAAQRWQQTRDSVAAASIAREHGPRVNVRANYTTFGSQRRVRVSFDARDDAYVLVGHVDSRGELTVLFPRTPRDDGFVEGGKSYRIPEFDAGFTNEYAFARQVSAYRYRSLASRFQSYDGGTGYVFIIAGWKPMRFDRIVDDSTWSSYELVDAYQTRDPRDAVDELAALIAADGPETYTVDYAHYYRSNMWGGYYANGLNYGDSFCDNFGFDAFYPSYAGFGALGFITPSWMLPGGYLYVPTYDPFTGCRSYRLVYAPSPITYGVVGRPQTPTDTSAHGNGERPWHKNPRYPLTPTGGNTVTLASRSIVPPAKMDPRYKDRGLLTLDDAGQPARIRRPDVGGFNRQLPDTRIQLERPGMTEMVLSHRQPDATTRQPRGFDNGRTQWSGPASRGTSGGAAQRRPSGSESPRIERPHESPRYESPRAEPSHAASTSPSPAAAPRVETPPASSPHAEPSRPTPPSSTP